MTFQYSNAYNVAVRTDASGRKKEVYLTFFQDHPVLREDGKTENARELISTILIDTDMAGALSDALEKLMKEQGTEDA